MSLAQAQEIEDKLKKAGIEFRSGQFLNSFWGTRFVFRKYKTMKDAERILGPEFKDSGQAYFKEWCIEIY